jgi:hypothetical protein
MTIQNIISSKSSRLVNLSYFLYGYYFITLVSYQVVLTTEEQALIISLFGSFLGALIFYIKPVERLMSSYQKFLRFNKIEFEDYMDASYPVYKNELIYSRFLQDERLKISGAFFLGIGLVLSNGLLLRYNLSNYYYILVFSAVVLTIVGIQDMHILLTKKIPTVTFYYGFYNTSKRINEIKDAMDLKDWIQAERIVADESYLYEQDHSVHLNPVSYCPHCRIRVEAEPGKFCINCGTTLMLTCPHCGNSIISQQEGIPSYCPECGKKLSEMA